MYNNHKECKQLRIVKVPVKDSYGWRWLREFDYVGFAKNV